jgi:hypothetical protein
LQESPAKRKPEIEIAIRWQTVLDTTSALLLTGAAVWYFATPEIVERPLRPLAYDRDGNTYASLQCVAERNTSHLFTRSRVEPELKDSVELVEWNDLYSFAQETRAGRWVDYTLPAPDARCTETDGFVERVPRWDYFFGTSAKSQEQSQEQSQE